MNEIETLATRLARIEERVSSHEQFTKYRYDEILDKVSDIAAQLSLMTKVGIILAILLFLLEIGKLSFPALFKAITAAAS